MHRHLFAGGEPPVGLVGDGVVEQGEVAEVLRTESERGVGEHGNGRR